MEISFLYEGSFIKFCIRTFILFILTPSIVINKNDDKAHWNNGINVNYVCADMLHRRLGLDWDEY